MHTLLSHRTVTHGWCWTPTLAISVHMPSHKISAHCGIEMEPCPVCHESTRGRQRDQVNINVSALLVSITIRSAVIVAMALICSFSTNICTTLSPGQLTSS